MTVAVAGCGRLGFDGRTSDAPSYVAAPLVCDQKQWSITPPSDLNVDLSIAPTPVGVSVVWAPRSGGNLSAIDLDASWSMTSDQSGTSIKTGTYYSASLGYTNGTLAEGESDGGAVKLDTVAADLSGVVEQDCPTTTMISKPPFLHAGSDTFAVAADWNGMPGMTTLPFSSSWVALGGALTETTASLTGLAAVDFGALAIVAWSTSDACYVEQLTAATAGTRSQASVPCPAPRLAASGSELGLVFEAAGDVSIAVGDQATFSVAGATPLATGASSPRIAFDGNVFWYSYLQGGMIEAGYRAPDGSRHEVGVAYSPAHDAYELVIVAGSPWVFALDGELRAARLCFATGP